MERSGLASTTKGVRPSPVAKIKAMLEVMALGLRAAGIYERGRRNARRVILERHELAFPDLPPAFDGYRLLHITDPHFDGDADMDDAILSATVGLDVDLVTMTGDYRLLPHGRIELARAGLARLMETLSPLDGFVATLGNHDPGVFADDLEALGCRVLINEAWELRRGGDSIALVGTDDLHFFYTDEARAALASTNHPFRIAAIHSPDLADFAAELGYRFYLCGHTHGGQVCAPGGVPLFTSSASPRPYAKGFWRAGAMLGYTSRGAGTSGLPIRFNSAGEVTLFTLRRGPDRSPR